MKTEIIGGGIVYLAVILGAILILLTCKYDSAEVWRKRKARRMWVYAAIGIAALEILGTVIIFIGHN